MIAFIPVCRPLFPGPPAGTPINRLAPRPVDCRSANNPLTARVQVNRLWEEIFGTGIVETLEDFGTQGEEPSDQKLLDYLATEYVRLGWDNKALLKEIVCSATYQQTSAVSEDMVARDPNNRLLARGPRVRLAAETIRDQALFAAGLLDEQLYGPPCQPPKPSFGLTAAFGSRNRHWTADTGPTRYRSRPLYSRPPQCPVSIADHLRCHRAHQLHASPHSDQYAIAGPGHDEWIRALLKQRRGWPVAPSSAAAAVRRPKSTGHSEPH